MKEFKIRCRAYNDGIVVDQRTMHIEAENADMAYSIAGSRYSEYLQERRIIYSGIGYTSI